MIAVMNQWPVVRYKSRHAGGFDSDTPSLMMIRVPGEKANPPVDYDRYLNFPIPADDEDEALNPVPQKNPALSPGELAGSSYYPRQFTIVTVTHPKSDRPAEVMFQKYGRSGDRWIPDAPPSMFSCYACHPNGLRAISPLGFHVRKLQNGETERQMPPEEWRKVKEMNDAMDASGGHNMVSWRGAIEGGEYKPFIQTVGIGPVVGPNQPLSTIEVVEQPGQPAAQVPLTRQKEYIMGGELNGVRYDGCYKKRETVSVRDIFGRLPGANNVYTLTADPPIRWQVVRDSMNCASCHGNVTRGAFNSRIDFAQIDFKILVDQSMPHGAHINPMDRGSPRAPVQDRLNPNERIALANCLKDEFEEHEKHQLKKWLSEPECVPTRKE